MNDIARAAVD